MSGFDWKLTCWKGVSFLAMDDGISCSHCELCEKDSQRSESLKHRDGYRDGNVVCEGNVATVEVSWWNDTRYKVWEIFFKNLNIFYFVIVNVQ